MLRFLFVSIFSLPLFLQASELVVPAENLVMAFEQVHYSEQGDEVLSSLLEFSSDYLNQEIETDTETFQKLLRHTTKAKNYLAVKSQFEDCEINSRRNLKQRVTDQLGQFDETHYSCETQLYSLDLGLDDFINQIQNVAQTTLNQDLFEKLMDKNLEQAVGSLVDLRWRYNPNQAMSLNFGNDLCKKTCRRCKRRCSRQMEEKINSITSRWLESLREVPRQSPRETRSKLNQIITGLNTNTDEYSSKLLSPPGSLLLTQHMQDEAGAFAELPESKLDLINVDDVTDAVEEVEESLLEMLSDLKSMEKEVSDAQDLEENIKKLIKRSPSSVGEILMSHPELTGRVCNFLKDIEENDEDDETFYKWGGFIVGGIVIIGSLATLGAGAVFLAGGAAALQGVLLTAGALSLGAGGLVGAGLQTSKSLQNYQENTNFEQAIYANLSDDETLREAQESLADFYKARNMAILEFGTSLIPVGSLKVLSRLGHLKHASGVMKTILQSSKLRNLFKQISNRYGPEKLQELFLKILSLGPKATEQLLKMKNWSLSDVAKFMKWTISWVPKQQLQFWRSVTNPLRFFVKPRVSNATKLDIFLDPMGYASGAVLRSHQFRAHVPVLSSVGGLMWASIAGENKIRREVQNASNYIPGFEYSNEYAIHGILTSYERDELLRQHDLEIKNWSLNHEELFPKKLLELIRLNYLTNEEALALSRLAHRSYINAQESFATAKELNPELTVTQHLEAELISQLEINPMFLAKPLHVREMMYSFFDPLIKIKGISDLELIQISNEYMRRDLEELSTLEDFKTASVKFIGKSLEEGLPLPKALLMISQTLENPEELQVKFTRAQTILPAEKGYLGLRVDTPYENAPTRLAIPERPIADELDVWQIFMQDPRFDFYSKKWLAGEISDTEALDIAYEMIHSLNPLMTLAEEWKSRTPAGATNSELDSLFGISNPRTANILLKPIGQVVLDHIYAQSSLEEEGEEALSGWGDILVFCLNGAAQIWSEYYSQEAQIISTEVSSGEFKSRSTQLLTSHQEQFSQHLLTCKKEN